MTRRLGIDTSILVRLVTGRPQSEFDACVRRLGAMVEEGCELFASNQVIGEAYVAIQHHYGVSKAETRKALRAVLRSGLVAQLNGREVIVALAAKGGPGLFDRLIADDYARSGLEVLTVDRKMASLTGARNISRLS